VTGGRLLSIETDYELEDRDLFPCRGTNVFHHYVGAVSWVPSAFYSVRTAAELLGRQAAYSP
jgi:hypothetical protein